MPEQDVIEAEVRATLYAFLYAWMQPVEEALDDLLAHVAEDFTGLGTGPGDFYPDREALRALFRREKESMPHTSVLEVPWMNVRVLHPTLALAEGQLRGEIYAGAETHVVEPRCSFVLERREARWLLVHFHFSFADAMQEAGGTLMDKLEARNRELERLVDERTEELEKALRETEIEAALERVRTRTMAMQRSDELREVVAAVYDELLLLGFDSVACILITRHATRDGLNFWMSNRMQTLLPEAYHIPPFDHPVFEQIMATWEAGTPYRVVEMEGAVKHSFQQKLLEETDLRKLPEPVKARMRAGDRVVFSDAFTPHSILEAVAEVPLPEDKAALLQRFAHVFDQSYRRFLDLKKAEAQAREARVEAALERVRARAMAMHHSDDLASVVAVMLREQRALGIESLRSGIGLITEGVYKADVWTAGTSDDGKDIFELGFQIPLEGHPAVERLYAAWKDQANWYLIDLSGEDLTAYVQFMKERKARVFPERPGFNLAALPRIVLHFFPFPEGAVSVLAAAPLPEPVLHELRRLADAFSFAYTRFLDLQRAEAQAREAQIEVALERVRARAMAMHHSDELAEAAGIVFQQLTALGVVAETDRSGFGVIDEANDEATLWWTEQGGGVIHQGFTIQLGEFPTIAANYKVYRDTPPAERKELVFVNEYTGDLLREFVAYLIDKTDFGRDEATQQSREAPPERWIDYLVGYSHGYLTLGRFEPLEPEAVALLQRFARVFDQTYTRFLDLKQAEAQAREAQIEAALERVRARAMAMHHSDDLASVAAAVFEELNRLGFSALRCGIGIIEGETRTVVVWTTVSTDQGEVVQVAGDEKLEGHPLSDAIFAAWSRQTDVSYTLEGDDLASYYAEMDASNLHLPVGSTTSAVPSDARQFYHCAMFPAGGLYAFRNAPFSEEATRVMRRFADVFHLAYTRFEDIQQAEAQAREARIEAALERVRARTMAMHHSDELADAARVVFEELEKLGIAPRRCGFAIKQAEGPVWQFWHTTGGGQAIEQAGRLSEDQVPFFADVFAAWRQGEVASHTSTFVGAALDRVIHFLTERTEVNLPDAERELQQGAYPSQVCFNFFFFAHGSLLAHTLRPLVADDRAVLMRFARVFEQTYTRFLDLQQVEAQARAATRQAALDRVRAEIASMRTAADLERITPLIWRELTTLGVPFFRCGVFIIDEENKVAQVFLTTPEGKALAALTLGFGEAPVIDETVAHWRQGVVYTEQWDAAQMKDWTDFLQGRGLITTPARYLDDAAPPAHLALHFVPFAQGMLYVGSAAPLDPEQLNAAQALADAFAVAYARYEDFQRLEAAKSEVETTLDDLKAAQQQLVHAEKMASLGALTAGVAHEIKNPLNFVNNFAALSRELVDELTDELQAQTDPDEIRALLADLKTNARKIEEHGRRADGIVRAMLEHSRGTSGERRAVDLNGLVSEYLALAYHGKRARQAGFEAHLVEDLGEDVGEVELVPQEIGRVLLNLFGNAFDAVQERAVSVNGRYAPEVRVTTRRVGEEVEIRVEDNGPGIAAEVRGRIFEPFFTTKPTGAGTGLGLSLSYDIITQGHGGTLAVESEDGQGAVFVVRLPGANL